MYRAQGGEGGSLLRAQGREPQGNEGVATTSRLMTLLSRGGGKGIPFVHSGGGGHACDDVGARGGVPRPHRLDRQAGGEVTEVAGGGARWLGTLGAAAGQILARGTPASPPAAGRSGGAPGEAGGLRDLPVAGSQRLLDLHGRFGLFEMGCAENYHMGLVDLHGVVKNGTCNPLRAALECLRGHGREANAHSRRAHHGFTAVECPDSVRYNANELSVLMKYELSILAYTMR